MIHLGPAIAVAPEDLRQTLNRARKLVPFPRHFPVLNDFPPGLEVDVLKSGHDQSPDPGVPLLQANLYRVLRLTLNLRKTGVTANMKRMVALYGEQVRTVGQKCREAGTDAGKIAASRS